MTHPTAQSLRQQEKALAERIVELQYARQPEVWKPYGHPGREKSVRDAGYHLIYLAEALEADDAGLFSEYLAWVKELFTGLKFPDSVLPSTLECTRQVLSEHLPAEIGAPALALLETGIHELAHMSASTASFIDAQAPLGELAGQYLAALLQADRQAASRLILDAADNGVSVKDIYSEVFARAQREIGRLWQTNRISVAQEHFCTAATQMIMSQLYPRIFTGARKDRRLVVGCVGGELHEIGARMVADFFEMEGWDTYFLGANTPLESILCIVDERRADVLALSATMTFHVSAVSQIIAALRGSRAASHTRVLVGGYPFNLSPQLWQRIGADGYAPDAGTAIAIAESVLIS